MRDDSENDGPMGLRTWGSHREEHTGYHGKTVKEQYNLQAQSTWIQKGKVMLN